VEKKQIRVLGIPILETRITKPEASMSVPEKRSVQDADLSPIRNPKQWLLDVFGQSSSAGKNVTEETAVNLSAVWACVRILGNFVGMPPWSVYKLEANGNKMKDANHPINSLIHSEPNTFMTSFSWRRVMQIHASLWGNGYSIIHRDKYGRVGELELVDHPTKVRVFKYKNRLWYEVKGYDLPFAASEIFHIAGPGYDGISGKSMLSVAREAVGFGLAVQEFGSRFFANGSNMDGVLSVPGKLDAAVRDRIKDDWEKKYTGLDKSHGIGILEGGLQYTRIGIPPEDSQFLQSREFSQEEIARFFDIPPHKIALMKNATYTNIEHQAMEFMTDTMMPWYIAWEQEADRKLFAEREKGRQYTKFNLAAYMRGDAKSRAQFMRVMTDSGIMSINEARALEDMNKIDNGDKHLVQVNRVDLKDLKQTTKSQNN